MICEVNKAPLEFERIVLEELAELLAANGFQHEPAFHLYQNIHVIFLRVRQAQRERIIFGRRVYDEEEIQTSLIDDRTEYESWATGKKQTVNDEVERAPDRPNIEGIACYWTSRHWFDVSFTVDETLGSNLNKDGSLYQTKMEQDRWYFADEAELRQQLQEVLPLTLKVGLQGFDLDLEDLPQRRERERVRDEVSSKLFAEHLLDAVGQSTE